MRPPTGKWRTASLRGRASAISVSGFRGRTTRWRRLQLCLSALLRGSRIRYGKEAVGDWKDNRIRGKHWSIMVDAFPLLNSLKSVRFVKPLILMAFISCSQIPDWTRRNSFHSSGPARCGELHRNGRIEVKISHKIFTSKCCTSIFHG